MNELLQKDHRAQVLLGVWGQRFIKDFLKYSLPTLLADGNLPALSKEMPTSFVCLTKKSDIPTFEKSLAFKKLRAICDVRFLPIDDLIVFGNYSTTLTLAYDRAIQSNGDEMLKTYFVFLTSDYVMANGSMRGLLKYIKKGYSGICAGNFQVTKEEFTKILNTKMKLEEGTLTISPRELLKESFNNLHPLVFASFIDQILCHNYQANRFYIRPNSDTIAARFYLMHMLCIKPEIKNYKIGSSCDYSFIPAMCPSGNVTTINDSDDYLVVEIQSREHELKFITPGPYEIKHLIPALAEWTTQQHRQNANKTILFHTKDISATEKANIDQQLETFINRISKGLSRYAANPHDDHFYWHGAINSFHAQVELLKNKNEYDYVNLNNLAMPIHKRLFFKLFGTPPTVYPWHYRWKALKRVRNLLKQQVIDRRTVVLYETHEINFMFYQEWLSKELGLQHQYYVPSLLKSKSTLSAIGKFSRCIYFIRAKSVPHVRKRFDTLKNLLTPDGEITFVFTNDHLYTFTGYNFRDDLIHKIPYLLTPNFRIKNEISIYDNFSQIGSAMLHSINRRYAYSRKIRFSAYILFGIIGTSICFVRNLISQFFNGKSGYCTDVLITMEKYCENSNE